MRKNFITLSDIFFQALRDLNTNKFRSFLTGFGIAWGIASVIILMSFGIGFQKTQKEGLEELGRNIIVVWPGQSSESIKGKSWSKIIEFSIDDSEIIKKSSRFIKAITPEVVKREQTLKVGQKFLLRNVHGVYPVYKELRNMKIQKGRFINERDILEKRNVCVIGYNLKKYLFENTDSVGKYISIGQENFLIIGELDKKEQTARYEGFDNDKIFIPATTFIAIYGLKPVNNFVVLPISLETHKECIKELKYLLGKLHDFSPNDETALSVWDTVELAQTIRNLFIGLKIFLFFVGSITLAIGGVGVSNIMLVSVKERTREIGIKRSVGARRIDIVRQFLLEAIIITFSGGALGVLGGILISKGIAYLPLPKYFSPPVVSIFSLLISFFLLTLVGVISGIYPAIKASNVNPIDSLRYE